MIRPAAFGWNPETRDSNRFQARAAPYDAGLAAAAVAEFDELVLGLRRAGVVIHVAEDRADPRCPDAVFPNNWVSFHDDGTVVLYPMLAPTRRRERRPELLQELVLQGGYSVTRLVDLTHPLVAPAVNPLTTAETSERLVWRVPRLEFNETPLWEVVSLINQHSRSRISLANADLGRLEISGALRADNIEPLLHMLEANYRIKVVHRTLDDIELRR